MSYALKALFISSILVSSASIMPLTFAQDTMILSPLKQFKTDLSAYSVICKQGFQLILKSENNYPACVKPQTAQNLVERGWGKESIQTAWFEYSGIACRPTAWDNYWYKQYPANTSSAIVTPPEIEIIKSYFKTQGITLLEARHSVDILGGLPPIPCGATDTPYYFLVPQSDAQKMVELGDKMVNEKEVCIIDNIQCFDQNHLK